MGSGHPFDPANPQVLAHQANPDSGDCECRLIEVAERFVLISIARLSATLIGRQRLPDNAPGVEELRSLRFTRGVDIGHRIATVALDRSRVSRTRRRSSTPMATLTCCQSKGRCITPRAARSSDLGGSGAPILGRGSARRSLSRPPTGRQAHVSIVLRLPLGGSPSASAAAAGYSDRAAVGRKTTEASVFATHAVAQGLSEGSPRDLLQAIREPQRR
jgi:hypothetical protein